MRRKMKKFVAVILTAAMAMSVGVPAFAAEEKNEEVVMPKYMTEDLREGIDYEIVDSFIVYAESTESVNTSEVVSPYATQEWIVENIQKNPTWYDDSEPYFSAVSGAPGVVLSKEFTKYFVAETNITGTMDKAEIGTQLGFSLSVATKVTSTGTFTVPSMHEGKVVERAELVPYKLYQNYTFDVYLDSMHFDNPIYYGNYSADKPYGIYFDVVYYYAD